MTVPVIEARGVSKRYSGLKAVSDVSLSVSAGQLHSIIGPNGAGKSTFIACLAGGTRPTSGSVLLEGRDVTRLRPYQRCHRGLGRTFQTPRPFEELSVADNVLVAARFGGADHVDVDSVLERCGIADLASELAADLSHGQQRWLEFARTLATDPKVMLLDEVAAGLDVTEIDQLGRVIRSLVDEGLAVLMVEHVLSLVMRISDTITVLDNGAVIASGTPTEVGADPVVIQAYLGVK